jgi:hypothetical protein
MKYFTKLDLFVSLGAVALFGLAGLAMYLPMALYINYKDSE